MRKKFRDYGLIASLVFIIAIGGYWILQQVKQESLGHYVGLLGEKLLAMVPESSEKRTIEKMFSNFQTQVEEKQLAPEQVEEVAAGIINISNISDTVSVAEAEAILGGAVVSPKEKRERIELRVETEPKGEVNIAQEREKWDKLQKRLKDVYVFNERLKKRTEDREAEQRYMYHIDKNLKIIADSKIRPALEAENRSNRQIEREMRELERQNIIIWREDLQSQLKEQVKMVEEKLKQLQESKELRNLAKIKVLQNLNLDAKLKGLDTLIINEIYNLDSLQIKLDTSVIHIRVE